MRNFSKIINFVFCFAVLLMNLSLSAEGILFVGLESTPAPSTKYSDLTGFPNVSWTSSYAFEVTGAAAAPDGTLYLCNGPFTTYLYQATHTTTPQQLCTISVDIAALAYANGTLYGYSNYADPKGIYSIDTSTGQASLVLDVHTGTNFRFFALDYNSVDGLFYGYTEYGVSGLYSIDISTGVMTHIIGSIPATNTQGRGLAVGDNIVYLTATRGDDGVGFFAYDLAQGIGGNWVEFPNAYPNYHSTGGAAWIPDQTSYIEIQGVVEPSDLPGTGLEGCVVILSGDQAYQTQTDENGFFLLEEVVGYSLYNLEISHPGYQNLTEEIQTLESNIDLGTIILEEIAFPAQNVSAEVNDDYTKVDLNWQAPTGNDRILEHYKLYRFLEINSVVPSFWELLADNHPETSFIDEEWLWLDPENYQYAVIAVYSNGLTAEAAFSNVLERVFYFYEPFDLQVISNPEEDFASFSWDSYQVSYLDGYNIYLDYQFSGFTQEMQWQFENLENGQMYIAGVECIYSTGSSETIELLFTYQGVAVQEDEISDQMPPISHFSVYPNPFNPTTTISFGLNNANIANIEIAIHNLKGQKVKTLSIPNGGFATTEINLVWDGTDDSHQPVASGVFLLRLQAGEYYLNRKLLLIK